MWNHGVGWHCAQQEESTSTASFPTSAYNLSHDVTRTVAHSPPPTRHRHSVHALTLTGGPPRRPMRPPKSQGRPDGGVPLDLGIRGELDCGGEFPSRQCTTSTVGWLAVVQGSMGFSPLLDSVGISKADLRARGVLTWACISPYSLTWSAIYPVEGTTVAVEKFLLSIYNMFQMLEDCHFSCPAAQFKNVTLYLTKSFSMTTRIPRHGPYLTCTSERTFPLCHNFCTLERKALFFGSPPTALS